MTGKIEFENESDKFLPTDENQEQLTRLAKFDPKVILDALRDREHRILTLEKAIAQLQKDWTPISEGLPDEGVMLYWQLKDGNPYIGYRNGNLVLRRGGSSGEYLSNFAAYRPLPSAYEGEGK